MIAGCFAVELSLAQPDLREAAANLLPFGKMLSDPAMLDVAVGIVGATVLPHKSA